MSKQVFDHEDERRPPVASEPKPDVDADIIDYVISQVLAPPVHEFCPTCGLRNPYCGCV